MRRTAILAARHGPRCRNAFTHTPTTTPALYHAATATPFVPRRPAGLANARRTLSSKSEDTAPPEGAADAPKAEDGPAAAADADAAADDGAPPAAEPTEADKISELEEELRRMKDQYVRSLAEQENTRRIAKRDVESARQYAVSSFAKSLLTTSDNLERAMTAVPEELRDKSSGDNPVLASLYEGIQLTEEGLTKAFKKNGLVKFGEVGDVFDPNSHEAMYEYPDPEKEAGSVGQVMSKGFLLHGRVIRPAEVGVVKKT